MTKQNSKENELIFYQERKGQSAIEYLMTYGWMLLVVAIVGGAIFATVSGQCLNDVSGFTGDNVEVVDYAISTDDDGEAESFELEIQNMAGENMELETIIVNDQEWSDFEEDNPGASLSVGGSSIYDLMNAAEAGDEIGAIESEACNDVDLEVEYERGDFDSVESATGTLQGNLELVE